MRRKEFGQYHYTMGGAEAEGYDRLQELPLPGAGRQADPQNKKMDIWSQKAIPPGLNVAVTILHHSLLCAFRVLHLLPGQKRVRSHRRVH